jgi:hypothetical protein
VRRWASASGFQCSRPNIQRAGVGPDGLEHHQQFDGMDRQQDQADALQQMAEVGR